MYKCELLKAIDSIDSRYNDTMIASLLIMQINWIYCTRSIIQNL